MIAQTTVGCRIAFDGVITTTMGLEDQYSVIKRSAKGEVFGATLRRVVNESRGRNVDHTPHTIAGIMCIGEDTIFVSNLDMVEAISQGRRKIVVANVTDFSTSATIVSPLANCDPRARFGALLAFRFAYNTPLNTCFIYIVDKDAKIRGSKNIGPASREHTAVAISKDGTIVCTELWDGKQSQLTVFRVEYGADVFETTIDECGSFVCNKDSKCPCRDVVIVGPFVVTVDSLGRMMGWHALRQTLEWIFDGDSKGRIITDVAVSGNQLAAFDGEKFTVIDFASAVF